MKKIFFIILFIILLTFSIKFISAHYNSTESTNSTDATEIQEDSNNLTNSTEIQEDNNELTSTSEATDPPLIEQIEKYTIKSGDTIAAIANKFGLKIETILASNGLTERSVIQPGDVLDILPINGLLYTVKSGDTLLKIANTYNVDETEIVTINQLESEGSLQIDQKLLLPNATITIKNNQTNTVQSRSTTTATKSGQITWTWAALNELNKIPSNIRSSVKRKVNNYAASQGVTVITKEFYLNTHI